MATNFSHNYLNLWRTLAKHTRVIKIIIGIALSIFIAAQASYIVWQGILLNITPNFPPLSIAATASQSEGIDNWTWVKQSVTLKKKVVAPKKVYLFPTLAVSVRGIIYRGDNGSSVAIIKSKLADNSIVAVNENLEDTDILVEKITLDQVVFLEADKRFTISREESLLTNLQGDGAKKVESLDQGKAAKNTSRAIDESLETRSFVPSTKAEQALVKQIIKRPNDILKYLTVIPIMQAGKVTGGKITILKQHAFFARMGLQSNDIVLAVDGVPVSNLKQSAIGNFLQKKRGKLKIQRGDEIFNIDVNLNV